MRKYNGKVYTGIALPDDRVIYATPTGVMADGTLVYTEIETVENAVVVDKLGNLKLILGNQYSRQVKYRTQTFTRL